MGLISGRADITYSGKTIKNSNINGVDVNAWSDITTEKINSGRLLKQGDSYSVVIGKNMVDSFDKPLSVNTKIIIGGESFNVVGITTEGRSIYMPMVIARNTLVDIGRDEFNSISVKIQDVNLANDTVNAITNKLMLSRGILNEKKRDFSVSNPASIQQTMQQTMSTLALFLGAIAAISLIVGAIGIANTMFTSVLEKTKEIGIMKAIGTQNKDIMIIFLLNSGLIGLVGGVGGVIVGAISSTAISSFAGVGSVGGRGIGNILSSSYVSLPLIIGSILFAVIIGMVAGVIPAYRASKLKPVDALRYE
jgi:putative ABC transport system permease protein